MNFPLSKFKKEVLCGPLKCCLTSNLQSNSASGGSSRVAGHTAVLTSVNLLGPSNVQGPTVHILFNKGSRPHLKLTWKQTKQVCRSLTFPVICDVPTV